MISYIKKWGVEFKHFDLGIDFCSVMLTFEGSCFGHGMSKATQYAIDDTKVYVGFLEISLEEV